MLTDWDNYYTDYFYKQKFDVRDRCHPQIFKHEDGQPRNAIVLVHGLTDSPYFMKDIGEYFCNEMGFDVYIPLLRAHGLKEPEDMKDASLIEWRKDVRFAVDTAKKSGGKVSIGGLSTGGTLAVEMALTDENAIDGGVFLFSAALGLATNAGDLGEIFLRTPLAKIFDHIDNSNLINSSPSGNPFRYSKMDIGGASELSKLIKGLERLTDRNILKQPLFAAHSEADTTADIDEIEELVNRSSNAEMFRIGKSFAVPHASVVLKSSVRSLNNSPLEPSNPFFADMMRSLHTFADRYPVTITNSPLFIVLNQPEKIIMQDQCKDILTTFVSYIKNFNSLQPTSVVNFFHLPAMLMTSAQVAAMHNSIEVLGTFAILMDSLRAKKFDRSEIVGELKVTQLSDNQGMIEGVAKRFNQANEEIEHFGFTYTLRKVETEWKIIVGVIHEPNSFILST